MANQDSSHVAPNTANALVVPASFLIDIFMDTEDPRAQNDVYSLLNEDGTVHERRTVAEGIKSEGKFTLEFTGLWRGLKYSLEIDQGTEGKYFAFHDVLLEDLIQADQNPQGVVDGQGGQALPAQQPPADASDVPAMTDQELGKDLWAGDNFEAPGYVPPSCDQAPWADSGQAAA